MFKLDKKQNFKKRWYEKSGWIIFLLIAFFPLGLFLMWKYSRWNKMVKSIVSLFIMFCIISNSFSHQDLDNISLSADTGYNYNIYSEVLIEVKTAPYDCAIPENAFSVSGGEVKISGDSVLFVAQKPGVYEVFAEYEGVKSNTFVINYEDKEAIEQAEAEMKAKEEQRIKAETEAKVKAEAEAKARLEEEALARAREEQRIKAEAEAKAEQEKKAAEAKAEQERKAAEARTASENNYNNEVEIENISQTDTFRREQLVWLSETGEKYHNIPDRGRMNPNKARQVTQSEAERAGYGACSKCY